MVLTMTPLQRHRALGTLLGTAAGDALGAGYEFGPPLDDAAPVEMRGGGCFGWEPGEWTDDTAMAVAIAAVAASGADLRADEAQNSLVARWQEWARAAKDVGAQTRSVLDLVDGTGAEAARSAAAALHTQTGRSAGNGSLMRTAPVALAYLNDPQGLTVAARAIAELTHADPVNGEACVVWCQAIRHAVIDGELDVRYGLASLPPDRGLWWADRLDVAERSRPSDFRNNGWVVEALQAAWSAIAATPMGAGVDPADHLRFALESAVRGGGDTDTVAAIAGGLLGAFHGVSAIPSAWQSMLHGWPGLRARDLVSLAADVVDVRQTAPAVIEPPLERTEEPAMAAFRRLDTYFTAHNLTVRLAELEGALAGANRADARSLVARSGFDESLVESALVVRKRVGMLDTLIHAAVIMLVLPVILDDGEVVTKRPSLGAGTDPDRIFDLETDRRVTEFKLAYWQGHDGMRQRGLFADVVGLALDQSGRRRQVYVVGHRPVAFLTSSKRNALKTLSKGPLRVREATGLTDGMSVAEFTATAKIEIIDLAPLVPRLL
jgi:ADP-ribosylglycohydrolase